MWYIGAMDIRYYFEESRARVYLLWALLTGVGYVTTHFYQNKNINGVWFTLSVIGLFYMFKVMPLRVSQMKHIYLSWLVPIVFGIAVSGIAVRTSIFPELVGYLGVFWLLLQSVAFISNGLVDRPARWYFIVAGVNAAAACACYAFESWTEVQYLVAAIVTVWSMLMLWAFRTDA